MQRKKLVVKKIIAGIIVFLMTFLDCLPVLYSVAQAKSNPEDNVKLTGYFETITDDETKHLSVRDVTDENVSLNFEIGVEGKGYVRSAILKLDDNLNFTIKDTNKFKIKDNQIKIRDINGDKTEKVTIPIAFEEREKYPTDYFNRTNQVTFSGIYVDNKGDEHKIEKTINLNLAWNEETSAKIETQILKNINYAKEEETGKILQTSIKVSNNEKKKSVPIKTTKLKMEIPQIEGLELEDIRVDAQKLAYSISDNDDKLEENIDANYEIQENNLLIEVNNKEENGTIQNTDGEDIYLVTYFYKGNESTQETANYKVEVTIENYANNIETETCEGNIDLKNTVGGIVSYLRDDKTKEMSVGYLIANTINQQYDIEYTKKDIINISQAGDISSIQIEDEDEYYATSADENTYTLEGMSNYKQIQFSKENLVNLFGEEGKIEVLNMSDEILFEIKPSQDADESGNYVLNFETEVSKIKIRTSAPISTGTLFILSQKVISKVDYTKEEVRNFTKIINKSKAIATHNEGQVDDLGSVESEVILLPTKSSATLEISKRNLSTIVDNENVNFQIHLNNNDDTSDLYENPVFEIRMPQTIREINISNIDLFYANDELEITNVEGLKDEDRNIIRVTLAGSQSSYNINKASNGTVISLDANVIVDEFIGNISETAEMYYYNSQAQNYTNETDWKMLHPGEGKNGYDSVEITYIAPEELITGQASETKPEEQEATEDIEETEGKDTSRVSSVKQGADAELLEEGVEAKTATMYISMVNNTNKNYGEFKILGRIPFAGNKDIKTGEDLGTTVDTILSSMITSKDKELEYTVYYSSNGEATDDLEDENNGWSTEFYKTGGIKSYLIILNDEFILENNEAIEFEYDYIIPANLQKGDSLYGTYTAYYKELDTQTSEEKAPSKIGYETQKYATLEATIEFGDVVIKEQYDAEAKISISNVSDVTATNVELTLNIPTVLEFEELYGEEIYGELSDDNIVKLKIDSIQPNTTKDIRIRFAVQRIAEDEIETTIKGKMIGENVNEQDIPSKIISIIKTNIEQTDIDSYESKTAGSRLKRQYTIKNKSNNTYNNVVITKKFYEGLEVDESQYEANTNVIQNIDKENNQISWIIQELKPEDSFYAEYYYKINRFDNDQPENKTGIETICNLGNNDEMKYYDEVTCYQPVLKVESLNSSDIGFAEPGEIIDYKYKLTNSSEYPILSFVVDTMAIGNAKISSIEAITDDMEYDFYVNDTQKTIGSLYIPEGKSIYLNVSVQSEEDTKDYIGNLLKLDVADEQVSETKLYTQMENSKPDNKYSLSGVAYIDENKNQIYDETEEILQDIIVKLYSSETDQFVDSAITDISGRYTFNNLESDKYYVQFNYDDTKYTLSKESTDAVAQNKASVLNVADNYITDNISVDDRSVANVNLGLSNENKFDLSLNAKVVKMTVQNNAENSTYISKNDKLAKVDINPKLVDTSKVYIEYKIQVTNQGTIEGTASKIADYLTDDLEFDSTLNPDWYLSEDGNLYTTALADTVIRPGETKEMTLVLIKNMSAENTGLVHNSFEIVKAINSKGIDDIDSTPNNMLDEDDASIADSIIGITTGLQMTQIPIIIASIMLMIVAGFLAWKYIEQRRYV